MNETSHMVDAILVALRRVAGNQPVPLHSPEFQGNEWAYLKECLDTTFVSSVGQFVDRFEAGLVEFTGTQIGRAHV